MTGECDGALTSNPHTPPPHTGYRVVGKQCRAWSCDTTTVGEGCASCVDTPQRLSDTTCATCNRGYYEKDGTCAPFICETGGSGTVSGTL